MLFVLTFVVAPLSAQTPDSTLVTEPADSLQVETDSLDKRRPVGFLQMKPGVAVADTLPVRTPALDAVDILADVPGSFVYDFGTPGWPDGWSPDGLNPNQVALLLNGLPFEDLWTGRPHYNLLPLAFSAPLHLEMVHFDAPVAAHARVRVYDQSRPLTELHYLGGGEGLKSIDALHMQQRSLGLFGRPGILQLLGTYSGRAATGEYPGSKLEQGRQVQIRLRYRQPNWSFELYNLHNRRRIGTHGGVLPDNSLNFNSIYRRTGADVEDPEAQRRIKRNDLALTFRTRLIPGLSEPLTISTYHISEETSFRSYLDTLATDINRTGIRVLQQVALSSHRIMLRLEGWTDHVTQSSAFLDSKGYSQSQLHAVARDSLRIIGLFSVIEGSLHAHNTTLYPGGYFSFTRDLGTTHLFLETSLSGQRVTWIEQYGYGDFVRTDGDLQVGRMIQVRSGFSISQGAFDFTLTGFTHHQTHPADLFIYGGSDTVRVVVSDQPLRKVGMSGNLGWRCSAEKGFYFTLRPTYFRTINKTASNEHDRISASLPSFFVRSRLGARYLVFRGDLDFDLYLQGRFWTKMRSRTLHQQTALLVLPASDARFFGPSGTLDIVMEAGIRSAKVFVSFENLLSGTTFLPGNLIVPVYPLPARRFRFGVYWPILD